MSAAPLLQGDKGKECGRLGGRCRGCGPATRLSAHFFLISLLHNALLCYTLVQQGVMLS